MTIITTVITPSRIAVACDGFTTKGGKPMRNDERKFIIFPTLRCIASYWGLADFNGWAMHKWLKVQLEYVNKHPHKYGTVEQWCNDLETELNNLLYGGILSNCSNKRIGIQVACFEKHENTFIPEVFLISNFSLDSNGKYFCPHNERVKSTRRTYGDLRGNTNYTDALDQRKHVRNFLLTRGYVTFHNGDPVTFNVFHSAYELLKQRAIESKKFKSKLQSTELKHLASYPIRLAKDFQQKFYMKSSIFVGGRIYVKVMSKSGKVV